MPPIASLRPRDFAPAMLCILSLLHGLAAVPETPQTPTGLALLGQQDLDELKKPEYAASRCMLTPDFGSDGMTVAASSDRIFSPHDQVVAVAAEPVVANAKNAVRTLLIKHGPNEVLAITIRRAGSVQAITAQCADAKPYFELLIAASLAASRSDAAACADRMAEAARLHTPSSTSLGLAFQCASQAGRISAADVHRRYYEIYRLLILESAWSLDALDRIRTTVHGAFDHLLENGAPQFADDLKRLYEQSVAAASHANDAAPSNHR